MLFWRKEMCHLCQHPFHLHMPVWFCSFPLTWECYHRQAVPQLPSGRLVLQRTQDAWGIFVGKLWVLSPANDVCSASLYLPNYFQQAVRPQFWKYTWYVCVLVWHYRICNITKFIHYKTNSVLDCCVVNMPNFGHKCSMLIMYQWLSWVVDHRKIPRSMTNPVKGEFGGFWSRL